MRREYDFSKGVRGKFYRPGAKLLIPVYLEPKVQAFVAERAAKDGTGVSEVVNEMLMREIGSEPAGAKKASSSSKGSAQVVLVGSERLLTKLSSAGEKRYAARSATTGRFKDVQTYRTNPTTRLTSKTRALAAKKTKRAKR